MQIPIPEKYRAVLGADDLAFGQHGQIHLRRGDSVSANVANVASVREKFALRFHPDMAGRERTDAWKRAVRETLLACPHMGMGGYGMDCHSSKACPFQAAGGYYPACAIGS